MRVCLSALLLALCSACEDPENPCNAGGPESFTLGSYDAGTFTAWADGSTIYMSTIDTGASGSGQGGFSSIRTGTYIYWLVTGLKTKKAIVNVSMRLNDGEETYLSDGGGTHICIPDVGAVGEMAVPFPLGQGEWSGSEVDLIGETLELSIEGAYKDATLTAAMSGTLDMDF